MRRAARPKGKACGAAGGGEDASKDQQPGLGAIASASRASWSSLRGSPGRRREALRFVVAGLLLGGWAEGGVQAAGCRARMLGRSGGGMLLFGARPVICPIRGSFCTPEMAMQKPAT